MLYYLAVYAAMNLGALAVVSVREREIGGPVFLGDLRGLGRDHPLLAGGLALSLLSLASFPPTGGFLAKLYLFGSAIDAGKTLPRRDRRDRHDDLARPTTCASCSRSTRRPASEARPRIVPGTRLAATAVLVSAAVVLWLGVAPQPLVDVARTAAASLVAAAASSRSAARRLRPCLASLGSVTGPSRSTRPQARASSSTRGSRAIPRGPKGRAVERCDAILLTHGHGDHAADTAAIAKEHSAPGRDVFPSSRAGWTARA